jgi:hypothetical protein
MVKALAAAGRPRSNDSIRHWRCGGRAAPAWAMVIIADWCRVHLGELVREFARRWEEKHVEQN